MRGITFGTYNTALNDQWTLTEWELSAANYKSNLVDVPGRDGPLDLSTALTDGEPRYDGRTLTATFESSKSTRDYRLSLVSQMVNALNGRSMNIVLPDDALHYVVGRVSVKENYNNLAHASVTVTAICDPWRYANTLTTKVLTATSTEATATLSNSGYKTVVPTLVVAGGTISLECGTSTWTLSPGTYKLPELAVAHGGLTLSYSGSGTLTFTYREAIL